MTRQKLMGAGRFTQIWKITLPNIRRPFFIISYAVGCKFAEDFS